MLQAAQRAPPRGGESLPGSGAAIGSQFPGRSAAADGTARKAEEVTQVPVSPGAFVRGVRPPQGLGSLATKFTPKFL